MLNLGVHAKTGIGVHFRRNTQQDQSGLSITEYCQQHDLAISTFFKWRNKLTASTVDTITEPSSEPDKWLPINNNIPSANIWDLELSLPNGIVLRMKNA